MEHELTAQQAKMVIEYFSGQAAEDYPQEDAEDKQLWMTRFQTSLAVERQIGEWWWASLVETQMHLQRFDRDPEGYLNAGGYNDSTKNKLDMGDRLKDQVSWSIDNAWNNSGA